MKLLLTRHGETQENVQKTVIGQLGGTLSRTGEEQARRLRDELADTTIDIIVSSDLKRCKDTTVIINMDRDIPVIYDPKLREMNFGNLQGLPHGSHASDIDYLANLDAKFPHGESNREMITRVIDVVNDIYKKNPNNTVLIVSHSGPLSVIVASVNNQHLGETMDNKAGFASIMTFTVEKTLEYPN